MNSRAPLACDRRGQAGEQGALVCLFAYSITEKLRVLLRNGASR